MLGSFECLSCNLKCLDREAVWEKDGKLCLGVANFERPLKQTSRDAQQVFEYVWISRVEREREPFWKFEGHNDIDFN